jgi:UDP-N-acetylglucosamine--dolichyl-phosphate N-acetylglucosaminephosphotransferase
MMYFDPTIFNNTNYKLVLIFLYAAITALFAIPYVINKCKQHGYIDHDMHKKNRPLLPTLGGTAILGGVLVALALSEVLIRDSEHIGTLFIFYFVVIIYALFGLIDDIFHFKQRYSKIAVLLVLSLPVGSIISGTSMNILGLNIDLGLFYTLVIVPIYIMVVANLINIHAGFNGQGPGTTLVMLIAAGIKSCMDYGTTYLIYLMPILGSLLVFFFFNKYPAKLFDGNIGAFMMGSALGGFLIINHYEVFGVFILIPHIITFILDAWVLGIKGKKDKEWPPIRQDGLIIPHKSMRFKSFKNLLCTLVPMTEKKAAWVLIGITMVFCIIGVMLF